MGGAEPSPQGASPPKGGSGTRPRSKSKPRVLFGAGMKAGYWGAFSLLQIRGEPWGCIPWGVAPAAMLRGVLRTTGCCSCRVSQGDSDKHVQLWMSSLAAGCNGGDELRGVSEGTKDWVPLGKGGADALCASARPPAQGVQPLLGLSRPAPTLPSQAAYTCLFVFDCLRFSEFD